MSTAILILNVAILVTTMMVLIYAFPFRKHLSVRLLIALTVCFCWIAFCALNVFILNSFEGKVLFSRLRFLGFAPIGATWLLFISTVFERWKWLHKKWVMIALFLPSCATILFTLVPQWQHLVLTDFSPFTAYGVSVVEFRGGAWFSYHIFWTFFLIILSVTLSAWVYLKEKGAKRRQVLLLTIGCSISSIVDAYCVITNSPLRWLMVSGAVFLLNELVVVYIAFRHRFLDIAPFAMERVFLEFPDPVLVIDTKEQLRAANTRARRLFRLDENSIGEKISILLPEIELSPGDIALLDETGRSRFYSLTLENLKLQTETYAGMIVYFREITAQKDIEKKLNENLEFKARLLSLIAHDLSGNMKNQALLSSSLQTKVQPEARDVVNLLAGSTFASQELMSNILAWARSQETQFVVLRKPYEMHALIQECIETLETSLRLKKLAVKIESEKRPLIVMGDSEMIAAVIRNLLSNSIRYSPSEKTITIGVSANDKTVRVSVRDEGTGMSDERVLAITRSSGKFFTERDSSREGYGIGLTIARRFVELHEGQFEVESRLNHGTAVHFTIPL